MAKNEENWNDLWDNPAVANCADPDKAQEWLQKLESSGKFTQLMLIQLQGLLQEVAKREEE